MRVVYLPESEEELHALPHEDQQRLFLDLSLVLDTEKMRRFRQMSGQALYEQSSSPWGHSAVQVLRDLEAVAGHKVMSKSRFMDILKGRRGGKYPARVTTEGVAA